VAQGQEGKHDSGHRSHQPPAGKVVESESGAASGEHKIEVPLRTQPAQQKVKRHRHEGRRGDITELLAAEDQIATLEGDKEAGDKGCALPEHLASDQIEKDDGDETA